MHVLLQIAEIGERHHLVLLVRSGDSGGCRVPLYFRVMAVVARVKYGVGIVFCQSGYGTVEQIVQLLPQICSMHFFGQGQDSMDMRLQQGPVGRRFEVHGRNNVDYLPGESGTAVVGATDPEDCG